MIQSSLSVTPQPTVQEQKKVETVRKNQLTAFKKLCEEVAAKISRGEKAQGWEIADASFSFSDSDDVSGLEGSSSRDGAANGGDTQRVYISVQSRAKTQNDAYAAFRASCQGDRCRVSHIRFASAKPGKYGMI